MYERRFSTSPNPSPPRSSWQPPMSPPPPLGKTSFVGMARSPLVKSPSLREGDYFLSAGTIRPAKRQVLLEVAIPDAPLSSESPGRSRITRRPSVKQTFHTILRNKTTSQDTAYGPPELSCGESSQSEESTPSTPQTALSNAPCARLGFDPEEERTEKERQNFFERAEAFRDRSQFEFRRQFIPHHRFSKEEVPYMQSYSHVALHKYAPHRPVVFLVLTIVFFQRLLHV